MVDRQIQPYLIEINSNPSLEINCPLLSRVIPSMLENSFRIALDPLIPPSGHFSTNKRMSLHDHYLQNMKFELIFDENHEPSFLPKIYSIEDDDEGPL